MHEFVFIYVLSSQCMADNWDILHLFAELLKKKKNVLVQVKLDPFTMSPNYFLNVCVTLPRESCIIEVYKLPAAANQFQSLPSALKHD